MSKPNPERTLQLQIRITLTGKGGHSSQPFKTRNPISAGLVLIQMIQNKVLYEFDSFDNVKLEPLSFEGGKQENIIPEKASLHYLGECADEDQRKKLHLIVEEALKAISSAFFIDYRVVYDD